MSKVPLHTLRFVGLASLVFAGFGLWYNANTLLAPMPDKADEPHFAVVFYAMSALWIGCYLLLLFVGVQFLRLRTSALRVLVGVMVFEVVYFITIAFLWLDGEIGHNVAGATGVSSGGAVLQLMTLFPIWGPLVSHWAARDIERASLGQTTDVWPEDPVALPGDWVWALVVFLVAYFVLTVVTGVIVATLGYGFAGQIGWLRGVLFVLSLAYGLTSVRRRRKRRLAGRQNLYWRRYLAGLCPRCEYSLAGLPEPRCPECGTRFDEVLQDKRKDEGRDTVAADVSARSAGRLS